MSKKDDFEKAFDNLNKIRSRYSSETLMGDEEYKTIYLSKVKNVCKTASEYAKEFVFSCFIIRAEYENALVARAHETLNKHEFSKAAYDLLIRKLDVDSFEDMLKNIKNDMYKAYSEIVLHEAA